MPLRIADGAPCYDHCLADLINAASPLEDAKNLIRSGYDLFRESSRAPRLTQLFAGGDHVRHTRGQHHSQHGAQQLISRLHNTRPFRPQPRCSSAFPGTTD